MIQINITSGTSMLYVIMPEDKILYTQKYDKLEFGDIIVYKDKKRATTMCHRYFFSLISWCIVAGDNCLRFELINKEDIIGKAVIVMCRNKKKYEVNKTTNERKKYCLFLLLYIPINYIYIKIIYKHRKLYDKYGKYFRRIFFRRNELQFNYLDVSSIK